VLRYLATDRTVTEIACQDASKIPAGSKLIPPGATKIAAETVPAGKPAQEAETPKIAARVATETRKPERRTLGELSTRTGSPVLSHY